jgi:hypothetical protein
MSAIINCFSTDGQVIPVRFSLEYALKEDKDGRIIDGEYVTQLASIRPQLGLEENECIKEIVIPAKLKCDDGFYPIERISSDIFGIMGVGREYDVRMASRTHSIERIVIDDRINSISSIAFHSVYADTLVWPKNCKTIEKSTFRNAHIKHFEGMENVKTIKECAFHSNDAMETFSWPKDCTEIPKECFENCKKLQQITGIENVTSVGAEAFAFSDLREVNWPINCDVIHSYCFYHNEKLKRFTVNGPISKIEKGALYGTSLKEVDLSSSIVCDIEDPENTDGVIYKMPFYAE